MGFGITSAGASGFQNTSQINAFKTKLEELKSTLKTTNLDAKLVSKTETTLNDLNLFSTLKSPTVKDFAEIARKIADFFDHIAEIDESFLRDHIDGMKDDKKRAKGKMMTEFLQDQASRVSPAIAAMAANASLSSVEKSNASSSSGLSLAHHQGPEWQSGPPITEEDVAKLGISMEKVHNLELGEMSALHAAVREVRSERRASSGVTQNFSASTAAAGSLLQMAKGFSPDELKEMIKAILKRGVKDLGDVADLMKLVGELGMEAPKTLLDDITDALSDFIQEAAQNATSLTDFLSLVKTFQALTSDFGGNLFTNDLGSTLSQTTPSDENKNATSELEGIGIKVELSPTTGKSNASPNPLDAVEEATSGQKSIQIITGEALFAQAVAGSQGKFDDKKIAALGTLALEDINIESTDNTRPLQSVSAKTESSLVDSEKAKPEDFEKLFAKVKELIISKKSDFESSVLDKIQTFMSQQLATHLDQLL